MLGVALLAGAARSAAAQDPAPPNIVLVVVDDLGWRDLGCFGSATHRTPEIDALAASGVVFRQAYSNGPNCAPSRASLMSGQWTPRHGVHTVGSSARGAASDRRLIPIPNRRDLDDGIVTLAETLAAAGYVCASMGKWHLGADPRSQGFDVNVGGGPAGHPPTYFSPYRNAALEDGPQGEYLTDRLTDEALGFLRERADERFFLYLPYFSVHTPIQAPADHVAEIEARPEAERPAHPTYAAMVERVDRGVGRLRRELEALGLEENTLLVVVSDNGGHGAVTSMAPLRGAKGMLYEGGVRVPLVMHWPGRLPAGASIETPVIGSDLYPTLAEWAGADLPREQALDGVSLAALAESGEALEPRALFWHFPAYLGGLAGATWRTTPVGAIRRGRYKLLEFFEDGRLELYDLEQDFGERRNLAAERPELAAELLAELRAWRARVGAPVPTEPNPEYAGER